MTLGHIFAEYIHLMLEEILDLLLGYYFDLCQMKVLNDEKCAVLTKSLTALNRISTGPCSTFCSA